MNRGRADDRWFPCPRSRPDARLRLLCFPSAGAGASAYAQWTRTLASRVEVRPVQLPGRESRFSESRFTRCRDLADALADHVEPLLDRPIAFFGHSMGALVAFESARVLRRRGLRTPSVLILSSRPAPQLPKPHHPIYRLPRADFLAEVEWLFDPPRAAWDEPELMEIVLPILRADMTICDTYEYEAEPPLSCPIFAMGGDHDRTTPVESLDAWREQTSASFEVKVFRGGHFYLSENEATCLRHIERVLAETLVESP